MPVHTFLPEEIQPVTSEKKHKKKKKIKKRIKNKYLEDHENFRFAATTQDREENNDFIIMKKMI